MSATVLGVAAAISVVGVLGWYMGVRIWRNVLPGRPWQIEVVAALGALVGGYALWTSDSWVASVAGAIASVSGLAFVALSAISGLPQRQGFAVGEASPSFEISDHSGALFSMAEHRGTALLLKFYRGHW